MRQETPDKNHPLQPVIWMIVLGDLEERWAHPQPGRPDKIALLALNSTIFCLLLLSVSENVGQREAVDVLLKGRFTPPPGQSQLLTHWLDVEFTPILRDKAWNFSPFLFCFSDFPVSTNTRDLALCLCFSHYYHIKANRAHLLLLMFIFKTNHTYCGKKH